MPPKKNTRTISIVTQLEPANNSEDSLRGGERRWLKIFTPQEIPAEILRKNAQEFFSDITYMFDAVEDNMRGLVLEEIELTATISANGKISLIAGGLEAGVAGAIKFVFKRSKPAP